MIHLDSNSSLPGSFYDIGSCPELTSDLCSAGLFGYHHAPPPIESGLRDLLGVPTKVYGSAQRTLSLVGQKFPSH